MGPYPHDSGLPVASDLTLLEEEVHTPGRPAGCPGAVGEATGTTVSPGELLEKIVEPTEVSLPLGHDVRRW